MLKLDSSHQGLIEILLDCSVGLYYKYKEPYRAIVSIRCLYRYDALSGQKQKHDNDEQQQYEQPVGKFFNASIGR